jgi:hypothetical protein
MAKRRDGVNVTALARELGWSRNRVYRAIENGTLPAGTVNAELSTEQSAEQSERSNAEIKSLPQSVLCAEAHRRQKRTTTDIFGRIAAGMSEHGTVTVPTTVPKARALFRWPWRHNSNLPDRSRRPLAETEKGIARRIGQIVIGVPIVGAAIGVACLEMAADWTGVQAQITDPHWATLLGGIAVAAGFFLFTLPTALRFLDRRSFGQTILAVLFGTLCFCAVVMSSSNGMLTAIADGVLARESRETPLSKAVGRMADHLQTNLAVRDCGDSRKGSTFCNKTGNALEQADEKLVSEHEHIEEAADPRAKIAEQWFGATPIQAHTARVVPLLLVCLFVWIALSIGMELVFPKRSAACRRLG